MISYFSTPLGVRTPLSWRYHILVGVVCPQREGTFQVILPYHQPSRWNPWFSCREVCVTPFRGTYSGAEVLLAEINWKSDPSWLTLSLCLFPFPSLETYAQKLVALLQQPNSCSSQTSWVPLTGPVPRLFLEESHKLEEGFCTSRPKQRHIDRYCVDIPLPRLGLDVNLEGIWLVHRGLSDGRFDLVGYLRWRPMIIPVFFWGL